MAEEEKKGQRWPSAAELDLQDRLGANRDQSDTDGAVVSTQSGRDFAVEDNDTSGYVGVSPEYMTYANDTDKPLQAEEGPFKDAEDEIHSRLGGAVGKEPSAEDNATQGGGSNDPLVYPAVSGDVVQAEEVDRQKVHADAVKAADQAASGDSAPRSRKAAPARPAAPSGQGDGGQ
jgi:hypothetical protein